MLELGFPLAPADAYAWPGGYPIGYLVDDGEYLCAACVNDETNPVHSGGLADGWRLEGLAVLEGSALDYDGSIECAHCNAVLIAGDDSPATAPAPHYHVASGIPGYGPDGADGYASFATIGEALEYARDELATFADMAHESAHGFGESHQYADAWNEVLRMESLELLRANLDPARATAPLYRDDAAAYAALQADQAAGFPHMVAHSCALYLWPCDVDDCEHGEEN